MDSSLAVHHAIRALNLDFRPVAHREIWTDGEIDAENEPQGIFGVPLQTSVGLAHVAISLNDNEGKSYVYGYVPIVVAKCGVFLKEKGKNTASGFTRFNLIENRSDRCGGNLPFVWFREAH